LLRVKHNREKMMRL
jgi:hypothetical protein